MDAASQQMDNLGGWEFREQAEAMLAQVGRDPCTVHADTHSVVYSGTALTQYMICMWSVRTAFKDWWTLRYWVSLHL
jgi:hypothetical protein